MRSFHALIAFAVLLAGWLICRTLAQHSWDNIRESVAAIPKGSFALALTFAVCSYLCLTVFDFLALRYVGKPLS